jgi:hypothetical protein
MIAIITADKIFVAYNLLPVISLKVCKSLTSKMKQGS